MTAFDLRLPATALAVLLSTTAAHAQVTAQQVWDGWKAQMQAGGGESTLTVGSESLAGGVLTVTEVALVNTQDGGSANVTIPAITFAESADGTVSITMSDLIPVAISGTDATTGESFAMNMEVAQTGLTITASGSPDAIDYAVAATRQAITVTEIETSDTTVPASFVIGLNDLAGTYSTSAGELMGLTYALTAASMDLLMDITDQETGTVVNVTGKSEGIAMNANGMVPTATDLTPAQIFASGLDMAGDYSVGASSYAMTFTEGGMTTDVAVAMAGGSAQFAIDAAAMTADSSVMGLSVQTTSPMMPFPINVSLGEYGLGMTMPMGQTGAPAPFGARINLSDLTLNDEIWAMFDPGAVLPRDPATVAITLAGTATMLVDLFDPAAQEQMAMTGAPPGELNSLDLTELTVAFGGAEITGTGALTFDNTDLVTFGGMPKPTGVIDLAINGANGMMDNLVQMGLIPEDQVMMGRMMLGMFAVPVGDDMLTSQIEFTADGGILANGQRVQ